MQHISLMNATGLIVNAIGGLLMFIGTPPVTSHTILYTAAEQKSINKRDKLKNRTIRILSCHGIG